MKNIKIAYLGGGSKQWARVFMNDLALCKDMTGEIGLYDIDIDAAKINQQIGQRINSNEKCISKWNYIVYDNLYSCLKDSTFVVISILPGTFEEMRSDVHCPEKYGIYQSVGDTAGPGGVLRAMRTVPIYEAFAKVIEEVCPKAWVINFTNPMSICTKALYDVFPNIKAFGCCHEVFHTQKFLCDVLEEMTGIKADRHELYTDVSGINHFTWITSAKYKQIEIFDYLDEYIERHFIEGHNERGSIDDYKTNSFSYANRIKMDTYKRYKVLGAAGDRHLAEFFNSSWYLDSLKQIDEWKFSLTSVDFRIKQMYERIQNSKDLASGKLPIEIKKSDEEAVALMRAILGLTSVVSNVNLPNEGQLPGLKIGSIVETNAVFSNDSVRPIMSHKLPNPVLSLVSVCQDNIEMLYDGISKRDFSLIFDSFINQNLCSKLTLNEAKELFKEMVMNTSNYLCEYYNMDQLNFL